jgi:hypothetical protein
LPQLPQFVASVCVSTHLLSSLQYTGAEGLGHVHSPCLQVCAAGHHVLQSPQWFESVARSTHAPLQTTSFGFGHSLKQRPFVQTSSWPHAFPQPPQFPWLDAGS